MAGDTTEERRRRRPAAEKIERSRGEVMPGWPSPLGGGNSSGKFLRRWKRGHGGMGLTDDEQLRRRMNLPAAEEKGTGGAGDPRATQELGLGFGDVGPLLVGRRSHTGARARRERVAGDLAGPLRTGKKKEGEKKH
jgi:hypothetical protein